MKTLSAEVHTFAYISRSPSGEGNYTISITIDGKTFTELGGTRCNRCYFNVSPYNYVATMLL